MYDYNLNYPYQFKWMHLVCWCSVDVYFYICCCSLFVQYNQIQAFISETFYKIKGYQMRMNTMLLLSEFLCFFVFTVTHEKDSQKVEFIWKR